ncbi:hypothetical protein TW95_gp0292 [Pandoravirus inopinatum]|uniref:Uncharacterized protein n=1 Tax=Pandoravirus inopinatum TaxID=1605721 RepID=A0A0B5J8B1_9VIRU|nr:hypothetical protein TW95_gp0292 [Pandoravirus inopinatum]AJF97026.1 hypothetical protein [Pandoravirus inopinatum]
MVSSVDTTERCTDLFSKKKDQHIFNSTARPHVPFFVFFLHGSRPCSGHGSLRAQGRRRCCWCTPCNVFGHCAAKTILALFGRFFLSPFYGDKKVAQGQGHRERPHRHVKERAQKKDTTVPQPHHHDNRHVAPRPTTGPPFLTRAKK